MACRNCIQLTRKRSRISPLQFMGALTSREWAKLGLPPPSPSTLKRRSVVVTYQNDLTMMKDANQLNLWLTKWNNDVIAKSTPLPLSPIVILEYLQSSKTFDFNDMSFQLLITGSLYFPWGKMQLDRKEHAVALEELLRFVLQSSQVHDEDIHVAFLHNIMTAWIRASNISRAREWLNAMRESKLLPNPTDASYSILLNACVKQNKPEIAMRILEEADFKLGGNHFEKCLRCLAASEDESAGWKAEGIVVSQFEQMIHVDAQISLPWKSLALVIDTWVSRKDHELSATRAMRVWKLLPTPLDDPDQTGLWLGSTLQVMKSWSSNQNPHQTERMGRIVLSHCPPEAVSTKSIRKMIQYWLSSLYDDSTIEPMSFVNETINFSGKEEGDIWTQFLYDVLLNLYSKRGETDKAEALLKDMIETFVEKKNESTLCPTSLHFDAIFFAWSRVESAAVDEKREHVLRIFALMKELDASYGLAIRPTVKTYNAILAALARSEKTDIAQAGHAIFNELIETYDKTQQGSLRPDRATFTHAIALWQGVDTPEGFQRGRSLCLESQRFLKQEVTVREAFDALLQQNSHTPPIEFK